MDPMLSLLLKFLLITGTFGAIYVGHAYYKGKDDNALEEIADDIVQKESDVDHHDDTPSN